MQAFAVVPRRLDANVGRLNHTAAAALGPALHAAPQIVERQISLIIGTVEPFGRHSPVPLSPADIHFPATRLHRLHRIQNFQNAHRHPSVTGAGSHSPNPQPVAKQTNPSLALRRFGRKAAVRVFWTPRMMRRDRTFGQSLDLCERIGRASARRLGNLCIKMSLAFKGALSNSPDLIIINKSKFTSLRPNAAGMSFKRHLSAERSTVAKYSCTPPSTSACEITISLPFQKSPAVQPCTASALLPARPRCTSAKTPLAQTQLTSTVAE